MADGPAIGTAYLRIAGDFSQVNSQVVGLFSSQRFSKYGKLAGAGLAAGIAAAGIGKALYDIGEQFDSAFDTITTKTGATGKELRRLEGDFRAVVKGVPTDFDTASRAVAGLNQRLGVSGKPLRALTKQFTELSRITESDVEDNIQNVTRAFGDWEVKTREQSKTLDYFFRASQESGASVSELASQVVQFGAPLRQVGFELEEATAMFAQFEQAGVNTQTMMPGLRMALRSFLEDGRDPAEALRKTFEGIEEGTISTSKALEIFGARAGADMIEAINQGRFDLDKFTESLARNDETIRGAGKRTMDFAEHWQKFKNNILVELEPVATRVFDAIGEAMKDITRTFRREGLGGLADMAADAFNDVIDEAAKAGPKIAWALVKGFINAPILTQLFVGGLLWRKFGGAFKTAGTTAGTTFARSFAASAGPAMAAMASLIAIQEGVEAGKGAVGGFITNRTDTSSALAAMSEDDIRGAMGGATPEGRQMLRDELRRREGVLRQHADKVDGINRKLWDDFRKVTDDGVGKAGDITIRGLDHARERARDVTARQRDDVVGNTESMVDGVGDGLTRFRDNMNRALDAVGAKKLSFTVDSIGDAVAKGTKRQRGGMIHGPGSGDTVPVMAEPGEGFINREAVRGLGGPKVIEAINRLWPRFQRGGTVGGGLNFALGPYDAPPIKYAADHAGGNSHVHITGTTTPWVVAIGRKLQQMGMMVSEHPAFGGVNFQHSATGGHYDALAIDVNTAADETRAEVEAIARLLGGSAGIGAVSERIKRLILQGPDGPLKDMGQRALDRVRGAGNRYLGKQTPTGIAPTGAASGPWQKIMRQIAGQRGWSVDDWMTLVMKESGGNPAAVNPSSGAFGLGQFLGSTAQAYAKYGALSNSGADQIRAMAKYIADRYGSPSAALGFHNANNWYRRGGVVDAGWFGNGGSITADRPTILGIGERGRETAKVTRGDAEPPVVNINFANGMEWLRQFVRVEAGDEVEVRLGHDRQMARMR